MITIPDTGIFILGGVLYGIFIIGTILEFKRSISEIDKKSRK
ncbi:MAG: hypothetical protein SH857_14315 [Chitinophagales bacterium]|nr:hypothetical protein [Chitinophagales bacterium]